VVGGGSAGAVAARRLVDSGARVLLLEAGGPDEHPAIHDPARVHELWGTDQDWAYETVPQAHASDRRLGLPRGKVLGGSSSLNAMIYVRGAREDYDAWAYAGNAGWGWDDVLPVFRRIEAHDRGASELHGGDGPLTIWTEYEPDPIHASLIAAAQEIGIPANPDYNSGALDGVAPMQYSIRGGVRASTAQAYLKPIADADGLLIVTGAHVTRVLIEGGRAVGVEWRRGGAVERAHAGEVVVSAGAIESPRVLMLSGVGPAAHLAEHGIAPVVDLPGVGANFHDHLLVPMIYAAEREVGPPSPGLPACQSHFWARTRPGLVVPDLQPIHFMVPLYEPWMQGPANAITLMPGLVRPASRGSIRLSGPSLDDPLLLDLGALSCAADLEVLVAGVRLMRELTEASALAEWGLTALYPAAEATSDEDVARYVRDTAITYHHQAGTCRMGVDADAVVDPQLRVHGIDGLRVADASVMPTVTTGNTNAPSIMIGERVAELIAEVGLLAA
jgi:choline dehydrogenase-like flavoprotein